MFLLPAIQVLWESYLNGGRIPTFHRPCAEAEQEEAREKENGLTARKGYGKISPCKEAPGLGSLDAPTRGLVIGKQNLRRKSHDFKGKKGSDY